MFTLIYAKIGSSPKNIEIKTRLEVVDFILAKGSDYYFNINGRELDWKALKKNRKVKRYLKLKSLNDKKS